VAADPDSASSATPAGPAIPQPVAYQVDAPNAYRWTEVAYDYLLDGKLSAGIHSAGGISTATVAGACPYCGDDVNFSEVLDAVTGESMRTLGWRGAQPSQDGGGYVPLTVSCYCAVLHPGRPEGISRGCGINFQVDVREAG
jgi:hypothetical protein